MAKARLVQQAELAGHSDRVWHLAWSPSSPTLASSSTDKSVRLYSYSYSPPSSSSPVDAPTYRFSEIASIPTSHNRTVRSLAFSPTGTTLATASFDATVGIWQQVEEAGLDDGPSLPGAGEWEPVDPLEGHESECKSVAWSADGRLIASCSRDKSVWIWEAVGPAEFECLAVLMEHSQDVKAVTWHPTDELLASASYDDTIKLWAADPYDDEWSCTHTLLGHTATVWSVAFSPCGTYLVSAGDDLVLKLWGRDSLSSPASLGQAGEAQREEGGKMGPWSAGGVRIGVKERWKWSLKAEIQGVHSRTVYSVDWAKGGVSESDGGLGRILSAGGDGTINVFQIMKPPEGSDSPAFTLVTKLDDAHGVSDVNHAAWCRLDPIKAAETLRALEGGERDPDEDADEDEDMHSPERADPRWSRCVDMFASAGDDGVVKVFLVEPILA